MRVQNTMFFTGQNYYADRLKSIMKRKRRNVMYGRNYVFLTLLMALLLTVFIGTEVSGASFVIDSSKTALIVVDMQNDFVRDGAAAKVPDAKRTIQNHLALINLCRAKKIPIVYTKFIAPPVRTTWTEFSKALADPPRNLLLRGLKRYYSDVQKELDVCDIIEELTPRSGDYVVEKHWYDGFFDTPLGSYLKTLHVKYVLITGTVTEICVEATTKGAYHRQFYPVVISDAISSLDADAAKIVLKLLDKRWARVATTDEIIAELKK